MTGTASAGMHRDVPASRSLDSTDRFDIGRYELTSVASKPAFFTIGVMNASLNTAEKQPSAMDLLNSDEWRQQVTHLLQNRCWNGVGGGMLVRQ